MGTATEQAQRLIKCGLSIIPIKADKTPAIHSWKVHQKELPEVGQHAFNGCAALICGKVSGGVETIDVDAKYDSTLVDRFQEQIDTFCPEILSKCVVQKTPSGGLHIIYKCSVIEGNKKLASRHTTETERQANPHEKVKVLIETRGEGGYIAIAPTPGYEVLHGCFEEVHAITPEERESLFAAARSLNEVYETVKPKSTLPARQSANSSITPWDDFNQKFDAESFLRQHDWLRSGSDAHREYYRRPGKSHGHSASYNPELKLFYCFTSSTVFEPAKAYTPAALYAHLECNGDFSEAAKRLYAQGFGERSNDRLQFANSSSPKEEERGTREIPRKDTNFLFRLTKPTPMERPKQLFGPLWAQGENAILYGEDGSCKTILATQIGCAIATGQNIGPFKNEVIPQPVALFDAELSDYQFNNRWPEGLPDQFKRFTFAEEQQAALVDANIQFVVQQIEFAASSISANIVILDNLSALTSMLDLTKTTDSIQLMGLLNELKRKGYSVLIVDHTRKPMKEGEFKAISKHDLQGSKMKSNLVDSSFAIGKSALGDAFRYIKGIKIRSFEMAYGRNEVATMLLRPDPLRLEFNGLDPEWKHVNDRNSKIMRMGAEGKTQAEIAREFGISQQAVSKLLNDDRE